MTSIVALSLTLTPHSLLTPNYIRPSLLITPRNLPNLLARILPPPRIIAQLITLHPRSHENPPRLAEHLGPVLVHRVVVWIRRLVAITTHPLETSMLTSGYIPAGAVVLSSDPGFDARSRAVAFVERRVAVALFRIADHGDGSC